MIGEGRFARVYRGFKIGQCNEAVAIRKLKFAENAAFSERRLLKEAEELLNLVHENIVKSYGALVIENGFVQEFCAKIVKSKEVHSLLGLINTLGEDFPEEVKLKSFRDISNALSYLHMLKVVVGDLKPANVLITSTAKEEWVFKLGHISPETKKRIDGSTAISSCMSNKDNFAYTAVYLAPEMLHFNSKDMNSNKSTACDIYSFGILMYQILFPIAPLFEEMHPIQFIIAITNNWRPTIPHCTKPSYKTFVQIIKSCWSNDPLTRPKSAGLLKQFKGMISDGKVEIGIELF